MINSHTFLPMGIWRLGRIDLVPIVKKLLEEKQKNKLETLKKCAIELKLTNKEDGYLQEWCEKNNLI